jgi:hypothetical protein
MALSARTESDRLFTQGTSRGVVALLAVALAGGTAEGQDVGTVIPPGGRLDRDNDAQVHSTAENVLRALQKSRPLNEPIPPASAENRPTPDPRELLWPEGARLVSRMGQLAYDEPWWTFEPIDSEGWPALKLLPDATLEIMVRSSVDDRGPRGFVVSGEMSVFGNENYLLPRLAMRAHEPAPPPAEAPSPADAPADDSDTELSSEESVEDVLAMMRRQRPRQEMIAPRQAGPADSAPTLAGTVQAPISDGSPLVARPGRIVFDDPWWTFVLESDELDYPEPPLRVLPNRNLELMIHLAERESRGLVFVVSGEITAYGGKNYLLTRAAMQQAGKGNLRK